MRRVDLNADVSENSPHDRQILEIVTSANVCLGEHAGDWPTTVATFQACADLGVRIGLHPGYPDRANMGRVTFESAGLDLARVAESIWSQVERACAVSEPGYLKPHGAFYHDTTREGQLADILADILAHFRLPLMGLAGTHHEAIAGMAGTRFLAEGFADRRYTEDGRLVPRGDPAALISDPEAAARQAVRLAPQVDSLCVHGDTPNCVAVLRAVRARLLAEAYEVSA